MEAKELKQYCLCLTPESQVLISAGFMRGALRAKAMLDAAIASEGDLAAFAEVKKMVQGMHDAMDRQGIDQTKLPSPAEVLAGEVEHDARFTQAAMAVPDKPALIAELIAAASNESNFEKTLFDRIDGTIEDIVIQGEVASAKFIRKPGQKSGKFLNFRKRDGGWLIHMGN